MDIEVHQRVQLASDLREAIAQRQLFLMYQPQIDVATGRVIGVEALARWRHRFLGLLPPDEFIGAAEKSGLIGALGDWVMREACAEMRGWLDAGIAPPKIAVNVSPLQFKVPEELERAILAALEAASLPPTRLEIELTESALMQSSREPNGIVQRIRARGIRLAIDDFGTGYSSLSYLRRYPVDIIKIAQDFVVDLTADHNDAAIVKAAIGLAQALDIEVIAEGVETAEQLGLLQSWGCGAAQGYYFAPPLDREAIKAFLAKSAPRPALARRAAG